jgi:tRNA(Arg) A34 adenosine deaminase TadA
LGDDPEEAHLEFQRRSREGIHWLPLVTLDGFTAIDVQHFWFLLEECRNRMIVFPWVKPLQSLVDRFFIRQANQLAEAAATSGADPFGAVLVREGQVVQEAYDQSVELSDPTYHAEIAAISTYCRRSKIFDLAGYTLYSSTEPCVMCSGAIKWARVSRVVFSVPQEQLQSFSGGRKKPSCAEIVNTGHRSIEVVGPISLQEGLAVLDRFGLAPKAQRHGKSCQQ